MLFGSMRLLICPLFAVLTWNSGLSLESRDTRDSHLPSFHLVRCGVLSSLILSVARGKDLALVFPSKPITNHVSRRACSHLPASRCFISSTSTEHYKLSEALIRIQFSVCGRKRQLADCGERNPTRRIAPSAVVLCSCEACVVDLFFRQIVCFAERLHHYCRHSLR
ncbi:hypothetical protein CPB85DRAFT_250405 [Mucidula mucida]|nr:hypothetical protein CPB85DRAFT_250405 [Mucidula mucida]